MYLGSFSCMFLYFFEGPNMIGIIFYVLASVGFTGSLVL